MKTTIAVLAAVFVLGMVAGNYLTPTVTVYSSYNESPRVITKTVTEYKPVAVTDGMDMFTASIKIPAVDNEGRGVATLLDVQVLPGSGRVLTNIDRLLFWVDTQHSIRTAREVAANITGQELSEYDMIYTIRANASVVEGPSAGAAMTVATVAALERRAVDPEVMITGTVGSDGSIGPVGGIVEKANASKYVGATLFLVPEGQSVQRYYVVERECSKLGFTEICTTKTVPREVDVFNETGIDVKEVGSVREALEYFY